MLSDISYTRVLYYSYKSITSAVCNICSNLFFFKHLSTNVQEKGNRRQEASLKTMTRNNYSRLTQGFSGPPFMCIFLILFGGVHSFLCFSFPFSFYVELMVASQQHKLHDPKLETLLAFIGSQCCSVWHDVVGVLGGMPKMSLAALFSTDGLSPVYNLEDLAIKHCSNQCKRNH